MNAKEWRSKSDSWRRGWKYGQGDVFVIREDSPDFIDGYKYALEHPTGPCYSVEATTGGTHESCRNV